MALTSFHTNGFCPTYRPSPWEMTQGLSSHWGIKYTPLLKSRWKGRGGGVRFGTERGKEVASSEYECEILGWKVLEMMEICAWDICGEQGGCWLESLSGERWNWRIVWTLSWVENTKKKKKRGVLWKVGVVGELLALRLGLRHASHLLEPLGPDAQEGSRLNLCYSGGVGIDEAYQHVWRVRAVGWETQILVRSDAGHL